MLLPSHLFHEGSIWALPLPDGSLQTRFRFASMEPPECEPGIYQTATPPAPGARLYTWRQLHGLVPEDEMSAIARSRGLLQWRLDNRRCGHCGAILERDVNPAEHCMVCPACDARFYPRIAPAVITLITRGDEVLLEQNRQYRHHYGTLVAGYIEPGESAETAVAREAFEETGISVRDIRFVGSQAWPFPCNLMLGFRAEYAGGELHPDGVEIASCRFYPKDALPPLPPTPSIARRMLEAWLRGEI